MADNWPITRADLRKAIGGVIPETEDSELDLFAAAATEAVDNATGRDEQADRHEVEGKLPVIFILAARETGKLWWQQSKNGPRGESAGGPPMGAALPRKVEGWLENYPPAPGFGQPVQAST